MKKTMKKLLALVLVGMMLVGTFLALPLTVSGAWDGNTTAEPAGSGTQESPYLITTPEEFAYLSTHASTMFASGTVYVELRNNLDMGGNYFVPIASNTAADMAVFFEGNGYTIANLKIYYDGYTGIFSRVGSDSTFRNLRVAGIHSTSISKTSSAGTIIGLAGVGLVMENCSVATGSTVTGYGNHAAGLVGSLQTGSTSRTTTFSYCQNGATVVNAGGKTAGGIVSSIEGATSYKFEYCVNTGSVTCKVDAASCAVGGLLGKYSQAQSNTQSFTDCYNKGKLSASAQYAQYVGGMAGQLLGNSSALTMARCYDHSQRSAGSYALSGNGSNDTALTKTVSDCYASSARYAGYTGVVFHSGATTSGIVDARDAEITLSTGTTTIADEMAKIDAEIAKKAISHAVDVWDGTTVSVPLGTGSESDPYLVDTAAELAYLCKNANSLFTTERTNYIELRSDLDLNGKQWTPMDALDYSVSFDGNHHTVSNLYYSGDANRVALFGQLGANSSVKNLHMVGANLTSTKAIATVASIVGLSRPGFTMTGCSVKNSVITNAGNHTAGLIGSLQWSSSDANARTGATVISYCSSAATICSSRVYGSVGGILSSIEYGKDVTFDHCANTGAVTLSPEAAASALTVGGILGVSKGMAGTQNFVDCYNKGALSSDCGTGTTFTNYVGGIVGSLGTSTSITLTRCYNVGTLTSGAGVASVYGLVGGGATAVYTDSKALTAIAANNFGTDTKANIDKKIAVIANAPILAISGESKNLSVRIKLTDPFGFMAITTVRTLEGVQRVSKYDTYYDEVGFVFLKGTPTGSDLLNEPNAVKSTATAYDAYAFNALYENLTAHDLDETITFAAYVTTKDGTTVLSEPRTVVLYDLAKDASDGTLGIQSVMNEDEPALYAAMVEYCDAYSDWVEKATFSTLKVATFNIVRCEDQANSGVANPDNIVNYIRDNNIDICVLNEVDVNNSRSKNADHAEYKASGYNQPKYIAEKLGYDYAFVAALDGYIGHTPADRSNGSARYGNAIISRYPIVGEVKYKVVQLKSYQVSGNYERRIVMWAEINVNGTPLTVVGSHFGLNPDEKDEITRVVREEVLPTISTPTLLMGDFNMQPSTRNIRRLDNASVNGHDMVMAGYDDLTFTQGSGTPTQRIDYIFYSDDIVASGYTVHSDVNCSDHKPVSLTIRLKNTAS